MSQTTNSTIDGNATLVPARVNVTNTTFESDLSRQDTVWVPYLSVVFLLLILFILVFSIYRYWERVKKRQRTILDYLEVDIDLNRKRICSIAWMPAKIRFQEGFEVSPHDHIARGELAPTHGPPIQKHHCSCQWAYRTPSSPMPFRETPVRHQDWACRFGRLEFDELDDYRNRIHVYSDKPNIGALCVRPVTSEMHVKPVLGQEVGQRSKLDEPSSSKNTTEMGFRRIRRASRRTKLTNDINRGQCVDVQARESGAKGGLLKHNSAPDSLNVERSVDSHMITDEQVGSFSADGQVGSFSADGQVGSTATDEQVGSFSADGQVGSFSADGQVGSTATDEQVGSFAACADPEINSFDRLHESEVVTREAQAIKPDTGSIQLEHDGVSPSMIVSVCPPIRQLKTGHLHTPPTSQGYPPVIRKYLNDTESGRKATSDNKSNDQPGVMTQSAPRPRHDSCRPDVPAQRLVFTLDPDTALQMSSRASSDGGSNPIGGQSDLYWDVGHVEV